MGDWDAAAAALEEAINIGDETGQAAATGHAWVIAARLAAARGRSDECRATLRGLMAVAEATGTRSGLHFAHATLGFLELGHSNVEALEHLDRAANLADEAGMEEPTLIPWAPDLVEAYLRAGRGRDARQTLAVLGRRTAASGTIAAAAAYARCRGLLENNFDDCFTEALRLDDERPMPFERARTLLAYGRRLHRSNRRSEARERLRAALDGFERLGAAPWAAQAETELHAAGGRRTSARRQTLTRRSAASLRLFSGAPPTERSPPSCSSRRRPSSSTWARSTAS